MDLAVLQSVQSLDLKYLENILEPDNDSPEFLYQLYHTYVEQAKLSLYHILTAS